MTILEDFKTSIIQVSNNIKNYIDAVVPKKVSELENDVGFLYEHQDISGKANTSDLATVATTGSYDDLNDKPSITTANSTTNGLMSYTDKSKLDDMTTVALEVTYADGSPSETLYLVKRSGGS